MVVALGCGKTGPDPSADVTLEDGTIVPVGKGTNSSVVNSSLLYNEYPFIHQKLEDSYSSVRIFVTVWEFVGFSNEEVSICWLFSLEMARCNSITPQITHVTKSANEN